MQPPVACLTLIPEILAMMSCYQGNSFKHTLCLGRVLDGTKIVLDRSSITGVLAVDRSSLFLLRALKALLFHSAIPGASLAALPLRVSAALLRLEDLACATSKVILEPLRCHLDMCRVVLNTQAACTRTARVPLIALVSGANGQFAEVLEGAAVPLLLCLHMRWHTAWIPPPCLHPHHLCLRHCHLQQRLAHTHHRERISPMTLTTWSPL